MAITAPASAATLVFFDRSDFNAAAGAGLAFESFEQGFGTAESLTFPGFTVSETGGANQVFNDGDAATDGALSVNIQDNGDSLFTFDFAAPINSFGGDFTALQDTVVNYSGGANGSFSLAADSPRFFGFISDTAFTSITFNATGDPVYGVDALSFGTAAVPGAVPEPTTWATMLLGFFGIGGMMRAHRGVWRRKEVSFNF